MAVDLKKLEKEKLEQDIYQTQLDLSKQVQTLMTENRNDFLAIREAEYPFIDMFFEQESDPQRVTVSTDGRLSWDLQATDALHDTKGGLIMVTEAVRLGYGQNIIKAIQNPQWYVDAYLSKQQEQLDKLTGNTKY